MDHKSDELSTFQVFQACVVVFLLGVGSVGLFVVLATLIGIVAGVGLVVLAVSVVLWVLFCAVLIMLGVLGEVFWLFRWFGRVLCSGFGWFCVSLRKFLKIEKG